MLLSIVSPIYKGEKMLHELVSRIEASVSTITDDYEIILVNDQSPDRSWEVIQDICANDKKVKGVNLSRNFGQHYAITAGLSLVCGEWVVVMDCDLQDRPEEIPNLYHKAMEGYDTVFAQRIERQDTFIKRMSSALYHRVFTWFTDSKADKTVANFGIYNKKVINSVLSMGDSVRSFNVMARWVGYKKTFLPVKHSKRAEGTSGYNVVKLLRMASNNIIAFSDKPLFLVLRLGLYVFITAVFVALYYLIKYLFGGVTVSGFTTIVISLWILGGIQIMLIGVVGLYIAKIFDRVKQRPLFIIDKKINVNEHTDK